MPTHINFRYERLLTVSSLKSVHFCRPLLQKRLETNLGSLARRCLVLLLKKDALSQGIFLRGSLSLSQVFWFCCARGCLVFSWLHEGKVARRRWDYNSHLDPLNHVDRMNHVDPMNPPPPGGFPIYYVPSSRTVSRRTPLETPGTNPSRGILLVTVLDEGI